MNNTVFLFMLIIFLSAILLLTKLVYDILKMTDKNRANSFDGIFLYCQCKYCQMLQNKQENK